VDPAQNVARGQGEAGGREEGRGREDVKHSCLQLLIIRAPR